MHTLLQCSSPLRKTRIRIMSDGDYLCARLALLSWCLLHMALEWCFGISLYSFCDILCIMEGTGEGEEILLFGYNVDSGVFSELKDYVHKVVSPSSYDCPLFGLTHGSTGMKKRWKNFLKDLDISVECLHRDEMAKKYPVVGVRLPAVFIVSGQSLNLLITAGEIGLCNDLDELMDLLTYKLKQGSVMEIVQ